VTTKISKIHLIINALHCYRHIHRLLLQTVSYLHLHYKDLRNDVTKVTWQEYQSELHLTPNLVLLTQHCMGHY
jgi:hypothetical protein